MVVIIVIHRCCTLCILPLTPALHSPILTPHFNLLPSPILLPFPPPPLSSSFIPSLLPLLFPLHLLLYSFPSPLHPLPSLNPAILSSSSSFSPFYSFYTNTSLPTQTIEVGFAVGVRALRISYVGELGWELHIPTEVICINNPLHPYLACLVTPAMLMS